MKVKLFSISLTLLLISVLFLSSTVAQDYAQWNLPDGAKARLGKGSVSGNLAYSPDGTRLAVASTVGIWLYDANSGVELSLLTGHKGSVFSIVFSPDGKTLASGDQGNAVHLWDAETGQHKMTLTGDTRISTTVWSMSFSPDSTTLAATQAGVGSGSKIYLWDTNTGEHRQTLTGHTDHVNSISFSPDGTTLASGGDDKTIYLWNAQTGAHQQTLTGHTDDVADIAFSPDGTTLASGSWDKTIRLWDAETGAHKQTLTEHTGYCHECYL